MPFLAFPSPTWCIPLVAGAAFATLQEAPLDEMHERTLGEPVDYLADVKPILLRRCYACHGPDGDSRKADLRLDDRADVTRARHEGVGLVIPGDAMKSELFLRITADNEEDRMPSEGEPLSPEQIDTIRRWIDQGAQYARHWSFEAVGDASPPAVDPAHQTLVRDPIDAFILHRIEERGLTAAGDAPPAAQLRRLAFDLTGLPPSTEDLTQFESDPSDQRWDAMVTKYLASEDYGERWGRHWLDLVRYAETCGHEFDYPIHDAWRYRDYVIKAINDDVPYDRFLREHVAGDLIDPRVDPETGLNQAPLATGFWYMGQAVHGPVDVRADELDRVENQIDVFSKAFMGLTVSCARCHDHKFDPILQSDYYGFAGYMRSSRRNKTYLDPHGQTKSDREAIREARAEHRRELEDAASAADDLHLRRLVDAFTNAINDVDEPGAFSTEIAFDDFEGPGFNGWVAEGNAFARGPQDASTVRKAFQATTNDRCVNTCDDRPGGNGDDDTGTLTSNVFKIEQPVLRFNLSGGKFPGETCINLLVGDEVVRTIHGQGDAVLREFEWDLSDLQGKDARLRIVDARTGGWGHVVVDDIRFGEIPGFKGSLAVSVEDLGVQAGLTTVETKAWLAALHDPSRGRIPWEAEVDRGPSPSIIFDDGSGRAGWFGDGHAWPESRTPRLNSGIIDPRLLGTIRSRTFPIEKNHVLIRVRGQGTVRVTVDGFMMDQFNALLFEGLKQDVVANDWRVLAMNVSAYIGERAWVELIDDSSGSLEVDWIAFDDEPGARVQASEIPNSDGPRWNDPEVVRWLLAHDLLDRLPSSARRFGAAVRRDNELPHLTVPRIASPKRALVLQDGFTEEEPVLLRGNHATPGAVAHRGLIDAVSGPLEHGSPGSGRELLADALVDSDNPLTTRVFVNRLWHHLTGRGIVRTTDDFGGLGAMPTHPDLLDHLATDFASDYSVKRMIGRIVRSSTYRRSTIAVDEEVVQVDPSNELLAHARIRRLQGEAIRDAILSIAGRLDSKRFGPSVPIHLTPFMTGRGRPGSSGPVDGDGRRSIYLEVRRNFPLPFLAVFDLPIPTTTMGTRNVSNVPAQSLAMMNDPFVHEMARAWAERARDRGDVSMLWREGLSREASQEELDRATMFLEDQGGGDEAWSALCHSIMNTKEFIYLN